MSAPTVVDSTIQQIVAMEDLSAIRHCAIGNGSLADAIRKAGRMSDPEKYYERAERMVWAVWRGGLLLREVERGNTHPSDSRTDTGLRATLEANGLKRDMAYRWIAVSWVPEGDLHGYIAKQKDATKPLKLSDVVRMGKNHRPSETPLVGDGYEIIHADLEDAEVADESIDCIITDPPYPREFIGEYTKLSQFAARVLKPGGSCLAMAGHSYLPEVMAALAANLNYHWTVAYLTPGGQAAQQWHRQVNTFWKPVFWFVKGEFEGEWVGDVVKSDVNDNDKRFHEWGQSESGMARLVEKFSRPGNLVCDPFVGGGTTAVAALARGRRFIGIDKSSEAVNETLERLGSLIERAA